MPITGLKLGAERLYYSKYDPDAGTPQGTKWTVKTLDSRVMGRLRDQATTMHVDPSRPDDHVDTSINMEDVNFQLVQFGVEWENLRGHDGQEIECRMVGRRIAGQSYKIIDPDFLRLVPLKVISELADEVRKDNEFGEDERGNSEGQSTQQNSSPATTASPAPTSSNGNEVVPPTPRDPTPST